MADNWKLKAVISANAESMLKTLKAVNAATKTTRKHIADIASSAGNLAGQIGMPLALVGSALGALSIGGLKTLVQNFAALGDQVVKGAKRFGMSTAEFQRWNYVAGQSGVSADGLASSVGRLNKNIAAAATGKNKDLAALFKRAGISLRDSNGALRDAGDLLPQIADLFQRNGNAALQARMGTAIFGKGWQELSPLLNGGAEEINALTARYKMLGLEISGDAAKAGEEFGDKMEDLHSVLGSVGNTIAARLLPVLSPMIENVIKWAIANRDLISTKVAKFVEEVAVGLSNIDWAGVVAGVQSFLSGLKSLVDAVGGFKVVLGGLVLFMNAQAIVAFVQMGGAIVRLGMYLSGPLISALKLAWLMMSACPVLLIMAAIVAFAVVLYKNWDAIVAYISGAWERIKAVFDVNFFDGLIQVWLEGWQALANGIIGIIKTITPDALMPDAMKNFEFSFASDRAAGITSRDRSSLVTGGNQVKASGQIEVSFDGLPYGARVETAKTTGDVPINVNAGYRSYAMGMP